MYCSKLHLVTIDELQAETDYSSKKSFFPLYPDPCTDDGKKQTEAEFAELMDLAGRRDDPCSLVSDKDRDSSQAYLGVCEFHDTLPKSYDFRAPISRLFNLHPSPLGAVLMNRYPGEQVIRTGRGLARAVESETPGIYHRHALNYLMGTRHWSPPRQALIWAALDVVIASALQAAWYYKWIGRGTDLTARRERPSEYADRNHLDFNVLYDRPDEMNPAYNLCPDGRSCKKGKIDPNGGNGNFSGTPRHPAYPSGHSTIAGAASEFLKFFFGNDPIPAFLLVQNAPGARKQPPPPITIGTELDNLAENIGLGRMWAGVHWRSDHEAGRKLGRAVACLVLQQLADMGAIEDMSAIGNYKVDAFKLCPPEPNLVSDQCQCQQKQTPCPNKNPQTDYARDELLKQAQLIKNNCPKTKQREVPCASPAPPNPHQTLDSNRSVQQGAL